MVAQFRGRSVSNAVQGMALVQEWWEAPTNEAEGGTMSVYKVIEIVGTSTSSWEDAAVQAVNTAKETLRDLRVAEVVEQDLDLGGGEVMFRTKLSISFKYQAD